MGMQMEKTRRIMNLMKNTHARVMCSVACNDTRKYYIYSLACIDSEFFEFTEIGPIKHFTVTSSSLRPSLRIRNLVRTETYGTAMLAKLFFLDVEIFCVRRL